MSISYAPREADHRDAARPAATRDAGEEGAAVATIEETRANFEDALITPRWADRAAIIQAADEYAIAVVDKALGSNCWSAACGSIQRSPEAVKRWGYIYRCEPCTLRAQITALAAPQAAQDGQEGAGQEGEG